MSSEATSGVGLGGLLFVLFVGLKLSGVINWSWWWVTAPLWGGFVLFLVIGALFALFAVMASRGH